MCINQLDIDERSSQVGMMGDIYRQPLEVQIWFGEVEDMAPDKANSPDENLVSEDHAKYFKCFLLSKELMSNYHRCLQPLGTPLEQMSQVPLTYCGFLKKTSALSNAILQNHLGCRDRIGHCLV